VAEAEDFVCEPVIDCRGELVEFAGEEVVGTFDHDEAVVARP
jgi:hypothetical protein